MFRQLLLGFVLIPVIALGQATPPGEVPKKAEDVAILIRLTVDAKAPPKPALKYQLLPEAKELLAGNPILGYMRCFSEQNEHFYGKEIAKKYEKWLEMPLDELPEEVRGHVEGGPLKRLDDAARLDAPHWGMMAEHKRGGVLTLLPDLQILRHLAGWNRIRIRHALKQGRFEDAIRFSKSGFQLARHMDENLSLIGDLVGVVIGLIHCQTLDEIINRPGAPNLFWALAFLPRPFVTMEKGIYGHLTFIRADFGSLSDPNRVWGEDELKELLEKIAMLPPYVDVPAAHVQTLGEWVQPRLRDEKWLAEERKKCIADGFPAQKVKKYPPEQLAFHALVRKCDEGRDDSFKYFRLPVHQTQELLKARMQLLPANATVDEICAYTLSQGNYRVKMAQARLDQRIALLQIVEALRWYAAENGGEFPKKLSDFKEPLPDDPYTGKPFLYELDGTTARVKGTPPKGMESIKGYTVHYEITLRK